MEHQRTIWWLAAAVIAAIAGGPIVVQSGAAAQSWLPWTTREVRPQQPPARRQPPAEVAPREQIYGQPYRGRGGSSSICLELEQRLAQEAQRQSNSGNILGQLQEDLAKARTEHRRYERDLNRRNCYETFLFTRSLRPSRACHRLDRQFREAERKIEQISIQMQELRSGGNRSHQDEIIRALARNNCGANYQQEARRRDSFSNFWQDNDASSGGTGNLFGGLPFATYRTLCVRTCDGYYFPVSFSTLPTHFQRDAEVCQSKCAAPTELYFHQNPGGSIDQMISQRTQQPYTSLKTAFRYRKEYVAGCSCKESEYLPQAGDTATASIPAPPGATADQRNNNFSPVR